MLGDSNIRLLVKEFNENRDSNLFSKLTNKLDLCKCIVTESDIIYPNTILRLLGDNTIKVDKTSALTKKIVNVPTYGNLTRIKELQLRKEDLRFFTFGRTIIETISKKCI